MKKMLCILLTVILIMPVCLAAADGPAYPVSTPDEARIFIVTLFGKHPEELDGNVPLSAQMQAAIDQYGGWKGMAAALTMQLGQCTRVEPAYADTLQGYALFRVPCTFAALSVDMLVFLDTGDIVGLQTGPYTGKPEETGDVPFDEIGLSLPVPALSGELPGTLTLPEGDGPFPAVVLVHGSGPSDRDETIGSVKPFRDLAEGLAEKGIAVYRYDKRTWVYGAKMAADRGVTLMDETVDDAAEAVRLLALHEKIDPDRIFVLGHSLGATAVPAIAAAGAPAAGYIMMAGSARPLWELMREQYDFLYSLIPELTEAEQAEKDAVFAELDRFGGMDALTDDDVLMGAYMPYWKWLAAYDMTAEAAKITVPCLVLQGEEDYQVTMADFAQLKDALGALDNYTFISYPGLIHSFTPGVKAEASAAYMRAEKVDPGVIGDIADFILAK